MAHTLSEIAAALGATVHGDGSLEITGACEPADAGPSDLALAMKPEYAEALPKGQARAAMLWEGADWQALGLQGALTAPRPRFAMAGVTKVFDPGPRYGDGIHPTAVIDASAQLGDGVTVGPFAVIGADVRIGDGSVIGSHVSIGWGSTLGVGALVHAGARIGHGIRIGARAILHQGAVIGADGLAFVTPEESGVEKARKSLGDQGEVRSQAWARIHSLGAVEIGDDVEIGANTCIDRGTIRATRIGNGVKFDNLIHIAHNVEIGDNCLFAAQVGIAGSTVIGSSVVFGGQVGVGDNLRIGDNVIAGGATKMMTSVPAGRVMLGYPAMQMERQVESYKGFRRLPRLFADVAALKKAVFKPGESD